MRNQRQSIAARSTWPSPGPQAPCTLSTTLRELARIWFPMQSLAKVSFNGLSMSSGNIRKADVHVIAPGTNRYNSRLHFSYQTSSGTGSNATARQALRLTAVRQHQPPRGKTPRKIAIKNRPASAYEAGLIFRYRCSTYCSPALTPANDGVHVRPAQA